MAEVAERQAIMTARIAELERRLAGIEAELDSHDAKDWEELAVEREEDEVLEGMGQSGLAEIEKLRAALARIEDGTYGTCVRCGEEISAERLDILPATPFCRNCAV
jgi:RNA polymerase-binding transcription factor DksA